MRDNYAQVERVQQVKELEQQLDVSQHQQERYLWTSVSTGLLLALFIYLFFTLWLKLRVARLHAKQLGEALLVEPPQRPGQLAATDEPLAAGDGQAPAKSERWYLSERPTSEFDDKLHYLLFRVPFLINSLEQHGYQVSREIEQAFGRYVNELTPQDGRIYDLREGTTCSMWCPSATWPSAPAGPDPARHPGSLPLRAPAGQAHQPRHRQSSLPAQGAMALDHHGLFDLCYLALSGAIQLSENTSRASGRTGRHRLPAGRIFNGDVWQCCLMAIDKGLVK